MKKNVLLVISFCFTALLFCNTATAQALTGVFAKASVAPQVDGVVDAVWADATAYNIDKPIKVETPTLGTSGETTWQALWNNEGVYILLKVTDDVFFPNWAVTPAGNNWEYDKPEIYFDVNPVLADGYGPGTASPNNKGHIQVAPGFPQGKVDGTINIQSDGITYAFLVTGNNYVAEYFVPFSKLIDKNGAEVLKAATIGFDVQLIDRDAAAVAKSRAVWANTNAANAGESYNNMNACGTVTLQGGDAFVYATNLTLNTGGTITTNNGTLQMTPAFEPATASNQTIKWSVVGGTGMATISSTGLLTGVSNGTVTVKAAATDGSGKTATTDVVISGQIIEKNEVWNSANLVKNWNFDSGLTSWGGWVDNAAVSAGQVAPAVVDGVCVMKPVKATDNAAWHYQHNQTGLTATPNVAYILKFKSWASADNTPCVVDFEDPNNSNKRYGKSTDAGAVNGGSEWNYTVGTTPQWFTFHVNFDQIVANTNQKLQWMLSLSNATISLDSVLLMKEADVPVFVNSISLNTAGTITTKAGTLQMVATVLPENATAKEVKWSVTPEGIATISATGLLTAVADGTVTVKAESVDGSLKSATAAVVVSGQVVGTDLFKDFNLIQNWNFDTNLDKWGGWVDGGSLSAGQTAPAIVDGVVVMKPVKATDNAAWHYQHSQTPLAAEPNVGYTLKFKSWASADATPCVVDFESGSNIKPADGGDQYARYGATPDAESADGRSEWKYDVNITPQWFTFHVTFDKIIPTTVQKIQWMLSLSNSTIYMDSVLLVKDVDLDLPVTSIALNTEAAITTNRGTLQMVATVAPVNAANKEVKWSVSDAAIATISPEGLLTAVANGTVTVKAVAADGSLKEATTEVVVSGQINVKELWSSEHNLIKNWNFATDLTDWGAGWIDDGLAGQIAPVVQDGVVVMKVSKSPDNWHYQLSQSGFTAEANVAYVLKFKSWATADATPCAVDFEDTSTNSYNRYGTTPDPESGDLKSEWHYNVNTTPQWFTFHVTFDRMIPTTVQKLQYMLSLSNETISLDSVLLVKEEYLIPEVLPVSEAGAAQSVDEGATVTLDGSLSSAPEGEELTYRWVAPAGITLSSTTEAKPTFTAPLVDADQTYTLNLVVSYGSVKPVADQVVVTVKQVDKAPYVKSEIQDVSVDKRAAVKVIDLKTIFADDDLKDVISYTVTNSNNDVVTGFVAADKLTLTFSTLNIGTSEMVVTATSVGKEVSSTFSIEVKSPTGINSMTDESFVQLYPNPTKGKFELKFSQAPKAGTMITVYNYAGQEILKKVTGDMTVNFDLSGHTAGMYFIKVGQKMYKVVVE